jgi:hypothetical protein
MATRLRYNGLQAALGAAISSTSATSITFAAALQSMGANIPTLGAGEYIALTIDDEIVHLTAYTSGATSGTIVREQEGTTAATHSNGATVVHAPTAQDFGEWTAFTPTISSFNTDGTIGNGTMIGRYRREGRDVRVRIYFLGGSTSTWGSGGGYVDGAFPLTRDTATDPDGRTIPVTRWSSGGASYVGYMNGSHIDVYNGGTGMTGSFNGQSFSLEFSYETSA